MKIYCIIGDKPKPDRRFRLNNTALSHRHKLSPHQSSFIGFSHFKASKLTQLSTLHKSMSHYNFLITHNTDGFLRGVPSLHTSPPPSPPAPLPPTGDNNTNAMDCDDSFPNIESNNIQVKTELTEEECQLPITPKLGTFCPIEAPNFRYSNAFPLNFQHQHPVTTIHEPLYNEFSETCPLSKSDWKERISPTPYSVEINVTSDEPSSPYNIEVPHSSSEITSAITTDQSLNVVNTDTIEVKQEFGDYYYCPISTTPPQTGAQSESPESGHTASSSYSLAGCEDSGDCIHSWSASNGGEFLHNITISLHLSYVMATMYVLVGCATISKPSVTNFNCLSNMNTSS